MKQTRKASEASNPDRTSAKTMKWREPQTWTQYCPASQTLALSAAKEYKGMTTTMMRTTTMKRMKTIATTTIKKTMKMRKTARILKTR